jgi:endoglycosylceramidase
MPLDAPRSRLRRPLSGRSGLLAAAALALLAGASAVTGAAVASSPQCACVGPPPPLATGWLGVSGSRIVDAQGRAVVLRGFNDDALLDYRNGARRQPPPLDDEDGELMRRSGFDVVRLPIAWSAIEPERGRFDARYLDRVEAAARLLERHGLRVVLDMHVGIGWGPDSEVPAWAAVPGVPDLRLVSAEPWRQSVSPQVAAAELYFWTSDDWQRELAGAWRAVAARFRDDPMLAGYDLFNEPHPLPAPPGVFENRLLWPAMARLITRLAPADPRHLFIVEGTLFDSLPTAVEPLRAPNVVYSAHIYVGSLIDVPLQPRSRAIAAAVDQRMREAAALPAPLWIGELGADGGTPAGADYTNAALDSLGHAGIGWAWWQWRQDGGWGVRDLGGAVDVRALRRLALPYLRAAPAGVTVASTGERALRIAAGSHHAGEPALVAWPELLLGPPRASGTCLRSATWLEATSTLSLDLAPGLACTVTIGSAGAGQEQSDG